MDENAASPIVSPALLHLAMLAPSPAPMAVLNAALQRSDLVDSASQALLHVRTGNKPVGSQGGNLCAKQAQTSTSEHAHDELVEQP